NGFDSGDDVLNGQANYDDDITDWVLVYLRSNPENGSEKLCSRAGLLHRDGRIEFINENQNCCQLNLNAQYYVVVEHRNHLIVMSDAPQSIVNGVLTYDFRNKQSYSEDPFGAGCISQKEVLPGVFCMFGGNGDQTASGDSDTDINSDDLNKWDVSKNLFQVFSIPDYDMNGDVNSNDKNLWFRNTNKFTCVIRF
nr:hypothetical protein [Saprospiraceae bacterium]